MAEDPLTCGLGCREPGGVRPRRPLIGPSTVPIPIPALVRRIFNVAIARPATALARLGRRLAAGTAAVWERTEALGWPRGKDVFRAAFEFSAFGVGVNDLDGRILRANPKLAEITGYSAAELVGMTITQLQHPQDRERTMAAYRQMIAGRARDVLTEKRYIRKDGATIWVRSNAILLRDRANRPASCVAIIEDITGCKKAEQDLRASEAELRVAFEVSAVGMAQCDVRGRFVRVNRKLTEITGYSADELLGMTFEELTHPADREESRIARGRMVAGQTSEILLEKRYVRNDGQIIWVYVNATVIRDEEGRPRHTAAVIQDITERKRAEEELRASEARFRTLADAAPVLIWMAGPDRFAWYFNRGWLAFTGRDLDRELGDGWVDDVHPDDLPECLESYRAAFVARRPFELEYRLRRHDGVYRWLLDRGTPLPPVGGEFVGYIGSCIDITERRAAEREIFDLNGRLEHRLGRIAAGPRGRRTPGASSESGTRPCAGCRHGARRCGGASRPRRPSPRLGNTRLRRPDRLPVRGFSASRTGRWTSIRAPTPCGSEA